MFTYCKAAASQNLLDDNDDDTCRMQTKVHLSLLHEVRHHDDTTAVHLPRHPPHVVNAPFIATCPNHTIHSVTFTFSLERIVPPSADATVWNSLPSLVTNSDSSKTFKSWKLKNYFLRIASDGSIHV